ncbi:MAG: SUMF1/EgtB/PvdO family nonheme iron enzyme [Lewinellaceae bacterium]|nr:SUMF1/EgtB/PvdO family nonheme iron enzyme [Lewinellaceae bacterium]
MGLLRCSGNVWEWCAIRYGDYPSHPMETNPHGPESGAYRVYRGGSWVDVPPGCRVAYRFNGQPSTMRVFDLGFRLAASPQ